MGPEALGLALGRSQELQTSRSVYFSCGQMPGKPLGLLGPIARAETLRQVRHLGCKCV
jgi:hypothetical protein